MVYSNSYPGMENSWPWLWWEDESWIATNISLNTEAVYRGLTAAEKILIKKYPLSAYRINKNKDIAVTMTVERFGKNGLNDKSDAFRHAFFNAINYRDLGKDPQTLENIAKLFSDAHETEVPQQLSLEKQMDLFNNGVGHQIGNVLFSVLTSNADLANEVMHMLNQGKLMYLFPVMAPPYFPNGQINPDGDPNFYGEGGTNNPQTATHGITSSTKLTPTNQ